MTSPRSRQSSRVRILLLGAADVGKTAFVVRLLTKRFIGEYDQNKETLYTHRLTTADNEVFLEILDSANNADEAQMETNIRWADGFLLLFSVTDRTSFHRLDVYLAQILQPRRSQLNAVDDPTSPGGGALTPGPALVIAANKIDCPPHARRVTPDEARGLAARVDRPLFELSVAESPEGVQRAIEDVVRQVRQREQQQQQQASGGSRAGGRLTQGGTFTNVKRVLKEKIYKGSRSDTWMSPGFEKLGK